jgi:hypothetical protein
LHKHEGVEMTVATRPTVAIGSISNDTLRPEDLVNAFGTELERLDTAGTYSELIAETKLARAAEIHDAGPSGGLSRISWSPGFNRERAGCLLDELISALGEFAPPHVLFGGIEDDSDYNFGFWPDMQGLDEAMHDGVEMDGLSGWEWVNCACRDEYVLLPAPGVLVSEHHDGSERYVAMYEIAADRLSTEVAVGEILWDAIVTGQNVPTGRVDWRR